MNQTFYPPVYQTETSEKYLKANLDSISARTRSVL
jgi:hypothetical protein